MSGVNDIRRTFLEFFRRNGHAIVPSSPLVPRNDPTLMFTNSGMVQFKNVFTGAEKRPYSTATTAQKCVRAGGKHNDLDNVGYTARHHTFFEMLGNFSFADYFKERAIELAWTLVTREFDLPKDKLTVTVYSADEEAASLWRRIAGLPEERIIRIATSDNFWQMGDTGPCGPCSEIFYDHGDHVPGGPPGSPDADGDRFIEIWNLVFMQFEQLPGGERVDLPRPSIDTGMGLERVAAVLQGTHDNYEIDLFRALIQASAEATGVAPQDARNSHRVIADHLRASAFLVADGVLPSNEGRGYVLRRIMRRAMRHVQMLGAADPVMWRLVPVLVREMGQAYPELVANETLISETLLVEETRFRRTLARGLSILEQETRGLGAEESLAGDVAFKLYDTFGFPLDLTQDALRARGIGVDTAGFEAAMSRQRAEARAAWAGSGEAATEQVWFALRERLGATEFLGYSAEQAEGQILALVSNGAEVGRLDAGGRGLVIVNQTPFYAQSGGQVGDTGRIGASGVEARVLDTQKKLGDLFAHEVEVLSGTLTPGLSVELQVDASSRSAIRANHSATHLLHEAMREVLGEHVAQKGSLVAPDRLRFDFSQPRPVTDEELERIEELANRVVRQNDPVVTRLMGLEEARLSGARALFGEKYGEEVRVVSMGRVPNSDRTFSIELCGGTHVTRTGDIGLVRVVGEGAVAAGVRRIEALTGDAARRYVAAQERQLRDVAAVLKVPPTDAAERAASLVEERRRLERELAELRKKLATGGGSEGFAPAKDVGGTKFIGRVVRGIPARELKGMVDDEKKRLGSGVISFISVDEENKASIVVGVTADRVGANNAVDLVRAAAEALGGKGGGGRADLAQAGGPDGGRADAALAAIEAAMSAAA